jgi:hypothetical protein
LRWTVAISVIVGATVMVVAAVGLVLLWAAH